MQLPFVVGRKYHRRSDIHANYGGNAQAGIAPCSRYPLVFLFTAPAGAQHGYQDGWVNDREFAYTGEGQLGDMAMVRGNLAIERHSERGRKLLMFEKTDKGGLYEFLGEFSYINHTIEEGADSDGVFRRRIIFRLRLSTPCDSLQSE